MIQGLRMTMKAPDMQRVFHAKEPPPAPTNLASPARFWLSSIRPSFQGGVRLSCAPFSLRLIP